MFDILSYHKASSVKEATELLASNPESHIIAGGTDVLVALRHLKAKYKHLVDIHDLDDLKKIELIDNGQKLKIGSGVSFTKLIESELVNKHIPLLAEAALTVAGPQIRNMGTFGGNIANGATSADMAAPALVTDCELEIVGFKKTRKVSINGFHIGPGKVNLSHDEILTAFIFDLEALRSWGAAYYKYAMREAMDIATIGCAAAVLMDNNKIKDLRLAFAVAAPTPIRCPNAEMKGKGMELNEATLKEIVKALASDIKPRSSWRASKEFREHIIKNLAERMILKAAEKTGWRQK